MVLGYARVGGGGAAAADAEADWVVVKVAETGFLLSSLAVTWSRVVSETGLGAAHMRGDNPRPDIGGV